MTLTAQGRARSSPTGYSAQQSVRTIGSFSLCAVPPASAMANTCIVLGSPGRAPPGTGTHDEDDPFMSESSPRTPGTGSSTIGPTVPLSSTPLTETSLRHHDAGPLMTGRARSNSGRLPPAYDDSWDSDRGRSTHPGTASVSLSAPTSRSDDPVSEVSVGHTMSHSVTSGSTDFHESALIGLAARSLPNPPTTAATPSDLKDPSPFD